MKEKKLVYGVGINDADYDVTKNEIVNGKWKQLWRCPFYWIWKGMLRRCYSEKFKKSSPGYMDCYTVPEWHYFMTFKAWMEKQDWEGKELDKDIVFPGNKSYGPESCVFVDKRINLFVTEKRYSSSHLPVGVYLHKASGKFMSQGCHPDSGSRIYLGIFKNPEEAHQAWLIFKTQQAYILAAEQTDPRVAAALIDRYENYSEYFDKGT